MAELIILCQLNLVHDHMDHPVPLCRTTNNIRDSPREHDEEEDADAPDVAGRVVALPLQNLQ